MDVKEAVFTAKRYVGDLFDDEGIKNLGLEEVEFDDEKGEWRITVGFSRPWERASGFMGAMQLPHQQRSYKTVRISDKGKIVTAVTGRGSKT